MRKKVMLVFGTRPEAIKMAPVAVALGKLPSLDVQIVVTAQHRELLDQVLDVFQIVPDEDLDLMREDQPLPSLLARSVQALTEVISRRSPDVVLVHGDTTTTLSAALAAFYARVPVAHVEAGLRTGDMEAPWPEEANRRLVAPLASLHFAPTEHARQNLLAEGLASHTIHVTGNTVVDALHAAVRRIKSDPNLQREVEGRLPTLPRGSKVVLVTGHRRENLGARLESVCDALMEIAAAPDVKVVYPVHPNPSVRSTVHERLGGNPNIHLVPPLDYLPFVWLMRRADVILTDSGGIQEEAPTFGKPVLVLRDTTERPEAIAGGTARLVGSTRGAIVHHTLELIATGRTNIDDPIPNPFGDGHAGQKIAALVESWLTSNRAQ